MIDKEILDEVLPVPELEELKEQKIEELQEEGFVVTNFHSGGIFYTLLMVVLRIRIECAELFRSILNNMFVSHASGTWLDLKLADYGKKRKKAQEAQGMSQLSGRARGMLSRYRRATSSRRRRTSTGESSAFSSPRIRSCRRASGHVIVEAEKEGSRYNVPPGQISKTLVYLGELDSISNGEDWIIREEAIRKTTRASGAEGSGRGPSCLSGLSRTASSMQGRRRGRTVRAS
ncbi:MAG: baseplate J/gp47 family protein [Anaerotruncus massiliensis (ex Togo et al. 2019)]